MKLILIFCLFLILEIIVICNKNVIELTNENFESEVKFNEKMVILFYSNTFNNSKLFLPKFDEFASKIIDHHSPDSKFGRINIDQNDKIAKRYLVVKVPIIKYVNSKARILSYDINRKRDLNNLVLWFQRVTENVLNLTDVNEIDRLTKENVISLIFFGSEKTHPELFKIYKKVSNYFEFHYFFFCDYAECKDKFKSTDGNIILFKDFGEKSNEIILTILNDIQTSDLSVAIEAYSRETAPEYNDKYYDYVYLNNNPAVFLYNFKNNSKFIEIEKIYIESAKLNRDKVLFLKVTNMEKNILHSDLAKYNGLDQNSFPIIMVHDMMKGLDFKFTGNYTLEKLNEFINNWSRGPIEPYFKSENINNSNSSKIIKLSRNNFEEIVFEREKDSHVMVNFYANWHLNSTKFKKIYKDFFGKVKSRPSLKIAKLDISKNYINDFIEIDHLPTIMLFHKDNKTIPIEFDDDKTIENLVAFIDQNIYSKNSSSLKTDL